MKIFKWIQITLIVCSIITLTACSSKHKNNQDMASINDANAASGNGIRTSGLGSESRFGDQAGGQRLAANHRIYYFDFDSNVVHDQDKPAILAQAAYLLKHPKSKIVLEGHTDPRGSREYNIGLGERRAKAVSEILAANGVSHTQIRVVSYGAQKLASPGHTEEAYQQDRRAVIAYYS